jgi:hypothetical protein
LHRKKKRHPADRNIGHISGRLGLRAMENSPIRRIGILQCIDGFDDSALRYVILAANAHQSAFQFEFVSFDHQDDFVAPLVRRDTVDHKTTLANLPSFFLRQQDHLRKRSRAFEVFEDPPDHFQVISEAGFSNNYFYTSNRKVAVIALGGWKRSMAPPSILEFIQILVLQDAVLRVCPALSTHFGTRGCLFDFSAILSDVRQKVLSGFLCKSCQNIMTSHGHSTLVDDLTSFLAKRWLGDPTDPSSPTSISAKLGHDLFITKGLKANWLESIKMTLVQEGTKQLFKIITTVLSALILAALLWLGITNTGGKINPAINSPSPATSATK